MSVGTETVDQSSRKKKPDIPVLALSRVDLDVDRMTV